ncbi:TRAFs-binding domain-containing protein [Sphingorhabdus sp.]|jgi:tetratricopeptide (TPR) repeat protein|uniref:TRAFs-binding domain-containing protein n=2 Tax=Sphingorhabdus sp. TaxID=1902408 RepID=UPI003BB1E061|nr:DUF4071 domain-containing protein [Sphingomonadales bacterium]
MSSIYPPILSLARSGATSRAWDAFLAAGLDGVEQVEALTLKGRLLKDRARLAAGAERAALFAQSGAAYRRAAALRPNSYPLINAAAMALFAGDPANGAAIAQQTLDLLNANPDEGETPYWRAATFAEAHLLLGNAEAAKRQLEDAIALAPQAWEDRASTLRQFAQILSHQRQKTDWLDVLRPPPALHFSGMMGIAPHDAEAERTIFEAVAEIAPGSGFGALAAGSDIMIAEALLANGAELHVVLPSDPADFRISSVVAFDATWGARFEAMIDAATSITVAANDSSLTRAAINLADRMAMGMAVETASRFETKAQALRIGPRGGPVRQDVWHCSGRDLVRLELRETASALPGNALNDGALNFALAAVRQNGPVGVSLNSELAHVLANRLAGAAYALDCDADVDSAILVERVTALVRNSSENVVLASKEATMATLAEGLCCRCEPMGEMATADGAVEVYALICPEVAKTQSSGSG